METFSVLLYVLVAPDTVVDFVKANAGTVIDGRSGYGSIERDLAAIYIGLEDPAQRGGDALGDTHEEVQSRVKSVLLVTVSRQSGSKYVAFEIATKAAERWDGVISWDGLTDWECEYQEWQQLNATCHAGAMPRID